MISIIFLFFLSLDYFHFAVSQNSSLIPHCSKTNDNLLQTTCSRCQIGFILNHLSTACLPINNFQANCLQKSILEECMRCDCGYVLSEEQGICVPTPSFIIGCEVFKDDYTCIRPKKDFTIFIESNRVISIQFARGTNCEIRDNHNGRCEQCHSGFKLDQSLNCIKSENIIVNEFFSYFSNDGELKSRNIQFIADKLGVFPKIPQCAIQINYNTNNDGQFITSKCQKCIVGKVPNASKTQCLKNPFEQCGLVSDSEPNICIQCENNEDFYLSQDNYLQQLNCLPRKSIDPTDNCLIPSENQPSCQKCAYGLVPTFQGCALKGWRKNIIQSVFSNQKIFDPHMHSQLQLIQSSCIFWSEDNLCRLCQPGLNINNHGQCQLQSIQNCIIQSENGGCHKCESLFYLSETNESCIPLTQNLYCQESSGILDLCDVCTSLAYLLHDGSCHRNQEINCVFSLGKNNECQRCYSLYYLESPILCSQISSYKECLFSDGYKNTCMKCKKKYILDETNSACILQMEISEGKQCASPLFYFDEQTKKCIEYSFHGFEFCANYHPTSNECVQCYETFFLTSSNYCEKINLCDASDGLTNWCFSSQHINGYINEIGQVQEAEIHCRTNLFENICGDCELANGQLGIPLDEGSCISREQNDTNFQQELCFHLKTVFLNEDTGLIIKTYHCDVCQVTYYPDSNGYCVPLFQSDKHCQTNNGRSKNCLVCVRNYHLNNSTGICEKNEDQISTIGILFCEIMQDNICIKCQNLFYRISLRCIPIDDPDCTVSDGIKNICKICKLGYIMDINKTTKQLCVPQFCEEIDLDNPGDCLKCFDGFVLKDQKIQHGEYEEQTKLREQKEKLDKEEIKNSSVRYSIEPQKVCDKMNDPHCLVESMLNGCLECEYGYQLIRNLFSNFQISTCLKIKIENCLKTTQNQVKCILCETGYVLLENGQCFFIKGCIEYQSTRCILCKDNYYLKDGNCWGIHHCMEQRSNKCLVCESAYFIKRGQEEEEEIEELVNENEEDFEGIYVFNYQTFKYQLRQQYADECILIPHCKTSYGQSQQCYECENEYFLESGICISEDKPNQNCLVYGINDQDCIQCESLYFPLNNQSCVEISGFQNCLQSNGIENQCQLCQQLEIGYYINQQGFCERIPNCKISNGIDTCLLCDLGYFLGFKGGKCIEQVYNIEFCVEYSLDNQNKQICSRCQNFYYPFEDHCIKLDDNNIHKCLASDGIHNQCYLCESEYFLGLDNYALKFRCNKSKKFFIQDNLGCQQFDNTNKCMKCFDRYFLDKKKVCRRRNLMNKCLEYHPAKDECQVCRSGYLLKRLEQKTTNYQGDGNGQELNMIFCLKMNEKERVKNCKEYQLNTNKCVKCDEKLFNLGVVQYFLNETANRCENVLHLMCQTIERKTKQCLIRYIANCEMYGKQLEMNNQSECLICRNGYFLEQHNLICTEHSFIENCKEYSQSKQDTCTICQEYYFVDDEYLCSLRSPEKGLNCQVHSIDQDSCHTCLDKFVVDSKTGCCIPSEIPNCQKVEIAEGIQELSGQQQNPKEDNLKIQACLNCYPNFILAENKRSCTLKVLDQHNCLSFNNENHDCIECKTDYFLNNKGDCITIDSVCQIENCLKLSLNSIADDFMCEKCVQNHIKDVNSKCSPIDPYSDIEKQENDATNNTNIMDNQPQNMNQIDLIYFIGVALIVICFFGVAIHLKRHFNASIKSRKSIKADAELVDVFQISSNSQIQRSQIIELTQDEEDMREEEQYEQKQTS